MPYSTNESLPDAIKAALPAQAQGIWRNTFNSQEKRGLPEKRCFQSAWAAVSNAGYQKPASGEGKWHKVEKAQLNIPITKSDDTRQLLFGWASVAADDDGAQILDSQGDLIDIEDLEEAFYDYVKSAGTLNFMHDGPVRGQLVEAIVFTPEKLVKLGIPAGTVPYGAWVGYHIPNAEDYALAKADGLLMFSIEGTAVREEVI